MSETFNIRSLLYAIKDDLKLSMIDFASYLKEQNSTIETDNVKKNFMYVITYTDIKQYVSRYITNEILINEDIIKSLDSDKLDISDADCVMMLIYENIDVFVDITDKDDDTYIIEIND